MIIASNTKKLIAETIDGYLVYLIYELIFLFQIEPNWVYSALIFMIISIIYTSVFTVGSRNTLGRKLMMVKIFSSDGSILSLKKATLRSLAGILSAIPVFLGYLIALFHEEKLTFHDRIVGTIVYETNEKIS